MTCHDVDRGLVASAKSAFQNLVESVNLPKLYYGIVRRACLERLAETTGTYFNGVSPDMAAAIGLSKYVRVTHVVDYPLFVPGTSAKSTAGASVRKEHWGRLRDQPHLPVNVEQHWPAVVPMFFAVQTVWAQSAVTALRATGREALLEHFNLGLLHAMCAVFNPRYAWFTFRSYYRLLRTMKRSILWGSMSLLRGFLSTWLMRSRHLVRRLSGSGQTEYRRSGLTDIDEAAMALTEYLTRLGRRFATSIPPE